jgi:hypothetical protein
MKNKAWFFLLILLCGSMATLSAFAFHDEPGGFPGADQEVSNDEATRDREDAKVAQETCGNDCTKVETATCDAQLDILTKVGYRKCINAVPAYCARKCD